MQPGLEPQTGSTPAEPDAGKGPGYRLVEQPVKAHDLEGLKYVTERSYVPVLADEAVFSVEDALKIVQMQAAD